MQLTRSIMRTIRCIPILTTLLLLAIAPPILAQTTPNEQGTLQDEQPVQGVLEAGEQHQWSFEGMTNDLIRIFLTVDEGSQIDATLNLLAPDGTLMAWSTPPSSVDAQLGPFTLSATGTYQVIVASEAGGGGYTLLLRLDREAIVEEASATPPVLPTSAPSDSGQPTPKPADSGEQLPLTQLIPVQFDDYAVLAPDVWPIFRWEEGEDEVDAFVKYRALYRQAFPVVHFATDPLTINGIRFAAMMPSDYDRAIIMVVRRYSLEGMAASAGIHPSDVTALTYLELYYPPETITTFDVNGLLTAATEQSVDGRTQLIVSYVYGNDALVAIFQSVDELVPTLHPLMALMATSITPIGQTPDLDAWKNLAPELDELPETLLLPDTATTFGTNCSISSTSTVTVRSGPGTNYAQQATLTSGETRQPIGQTQGADGMVWFQLSPTEWVRSDVIQQSGDCSALPQVIS